MAMNPLMAWLIGEGIDVGAEKTGLKDRARGILSDLADAVIPPAAASDASAIPQDLIPADVVMTPAQEQQVMQNADRYSGYPYREGGDAVGANVLPIDSARQVQVTQMTPTQLPDMQMGQAPEERRDEVQDFVRMVGGRTKALMEETPEGNPKEAAALATVEAMAAKGMEMPDEPMDLGAPVQFGSTDAAKGLYPDGKPQQEQSEPDFFDKAGSFLTDLFGDEERMTRMALAFNSMRLQPDQGLASALSKRLDKLGDLRVANRTAAALRAKGTPAAIAAADYIEQTGDAKGGMKMAMEADQYVTGSGKEIEEKFGIKGLIPNKPYRYNKLTKKVEGVGGGDTIFEATKPSKGMQFVRDESGKILYEEPIPRKLSPEAAKTKATSNVLVMDEMDRLLNVVEESPSLTTGFGTFLSSVPTTQARTAQRLADTIKGNIGFDRLQRMREESPTGGALGQVAVQELMALQSTMGSLDLGQDAETVKYNLNRLKQQYAKTMLALADAQPNFEEYFPDFNRAAYEEIVSRPTGQGAQTSTKPQITPEQARAELARRRGQ